MLNDAKIVAARNRLIEACRWWNLAQQGDPSAYYDAALEYYEDMIDDLAEVLVELLNEPT